MTTKEWLSRGYMINTEINQLIEERDKAFAMATGTVVSSSDGVAVRSANGNSSENRFINYAAYSEALDKSIDELYEVKKEIVDVIRKVESRKLRMLLFMRYVRFMTWSQIAEAMDFSDYHVCSRLHRKALAAAEKIMWERN